MVRVRQLTCSANSLLAGSVVCATFSWFVFVSVKIMASNMNMREATLNGSILRVAYFCKVKKFALFCKVLVT